MYFSGTDPIRMVKSDPDMFWRFYCTAGVRTAFAKLTKHKLRSPIYAHHVVMNQNRGNEYLKQMIKSNEPFMFGRYGTNELWIASQKLMKDKGVIDSINLEEIQLPCDQSGLFPCTEDTVSRFCDELIDASYQCDLYGTFRMIWEDYFIVHYMSKNVKLTHLNMMDFWRYEEPFTCALKGKKVLVIHPLAELIESQYKKRELIYPNGWLPEFSLKTIKAVQTIAGERDERFSDWFEALDYMKNEADKVDFDIALLGCGAYGMSLAAHIKKQGKQAIYMGGVLQMLFGIRGKRWDLIPKAAELYNEHWVSPGEEAKPKNSDIVEGGCYW